MGHLSVSYINREFDKIVNNSEFAGTIQLRGSESGITNNLEITSEQQEKIKAVLLEGTTPSSHDVSKAAEPTPFFLSEVNDTDLNIGDALVESFERVFSELSINVKLGKPTHIAYLKDERTGRLIKLHIEVKKFKNREMLALIGETFDSSNQALNTASIGNYKKNVGVLREMVCSGLKMYTFDKLFELINN